VKACRLVSNKSTGVFKGTAFVEFRSAAAAAAAAAACARARAGKGPELQLRGRAFELDLALDKDGARSLAAEQAAAKGLGFGGAAGGGVGGAGGAGVGGKGADRRNVYLAKEGHIEEGSAAWVSMPEYDRCACVCVCGVCECVLLCGIGICVRVGISKRGAAGAGTRKHRDCRLDCVRTYALGGPVSGFG
jgi:hypothetical protein